MKRRSARPFTVEIKHTRASQTSAALRSRSGPDLWRDLPIADESTPVEVQPAAASDCTSPQPSTPIRRVLPSLVPTFSMPIEPETSDVPEAPISGTLLRVRRSKHQAGRESNRAVWVTPASLAGGKPVVEPEVTPAVGATARVKPATVDGQLTSSRPRAARRTEQTAALRPGERWKRRLPRVLW